jgi:hypothetical protein
MVPEFKLRLFNFIETKFALCEGRIYYGYRVGETGMGKICCLEGERKEGNNYLLLTHSTRNAGVL